MKKKKKNCISPVDAVRFEPDVNIGLLEEQVIDRKNQGLINRDVNIKNKSYLKIITSNLFTLFNGINIFLAVILFLVGSYKNALFMGVVIINLLIAIVQEIRAKQTIDKLTLIAETKAKVVRNAQIIEVPIHELVLDDIIILETGNQIPSDCIVIDGVCECNESLLTGESDAITKTVGQELFSGSFIVSGKCYARVNKIAEQNYVYSILKGAKYIKQTKSDIMISLAKIMRFVTVIIIPIGIFFYLSQHFIQHLPVKDNVEKTVASLIGMIPEGLMLLASSIFAVSVVRLSKHNVMVQDIYCTETLARVDTLCLDKTGTITEGNMEFSEIVLLGRMFSQKEIEAILSDLSKVLQDDNPTINAIREHFKHCQQERQAEEVVPFSSKKKWSGARLSDGITYVIGAAEFIMPSIDPILREKIEKLSRGNRVIALAKSEKPFGLDGKLPSGLKMIALVAIRDKIRNEAPQTLEYFAEQGVDIKIISGDNVITVSEIAKRAGVKNYDKYIDLSTLYTDKEVEEAALKYTVFGRVTPDQKKILVKALKAAGRIVAMTGDGVNDVLALKEADCSVAMASGAEAAKNVSQLVLLDSNFASMPHVVVEGRRAINNLQLSGSLFLVKTIYSMLLTFILLIWRKPYPVVSIQLTLISALAVGIPAFFLALEPNKNRVQGRFISNILRKAAPGGLAIVVTVCSLIFLMGYLGNKLAIVSDPENPLYMLKLIDGNTVIFDKIMLGKYLGTIALLAISIIQFLVLIDISRKFNLRRIIILSLMIFAYVIAFFSFRNISINNIPRNVFEVYDLNSHDLILVLSIVIFVAFTTFYIFRDIINKMISRNILNDDNFQKFKKMLEEE